MGEAQLRMLHKQRQHRVWAYRSLKSLWGHLRRDPIFFTLHHPNGARYVHGHGSVVAQLDSAFRQAPFGLVTCEPHWIYPLCNAMGASALLVHDTQPDHTRWQALHEGVAHRKQASVAPQH